jgi:hypothetical protein
MRKSALIGSFLHLIIPLASALSLTDFQHLSVDVSETCAVAYDRTIPSCTTSDFTSGNTCSSGCVAGLNQIASGVLESCGGVVAGSSTLLGRIFSGDIISSLCPNNGKSTSTAQQKSTTAALATTAKSTSQAVKSTSTQSSAATPSSSSTSTASSSSSAVVQSSSSAPSSTSTTGVAASSVSSSTSSSAAAQTSASQPQTQSGNSKSGMTVQQQQIAAMSKSGGGSPFDIVGYSAASRLSQRDLIATTLGITLFITGWLLR